MAVTSIWKVEGRLARVQGQIRREGAPARAPRLAREPVPALHGDAQRAAEAGGGRRPHALPAARGPPQPRRDLARAGAAHAKRDRDGGAAARPRRGAQRAHGGPGRRTARAAKRGDAPPRGPGSRNGPGEPSGSAPEPEVPSPHRATDGPSLEDLLAPPSKEGGAPLAGRPGKGTRSGPTSGRSRPSGGAGEPIPRNGGKPSVRAEMASIAAGRKAPAGGRGARPRAAEKGR